MPPTVPYRGRGEATGTVEDIIVVCTHGDAQRSKEDERQAGEEATSPYPPPNSTNWDALENKNVQRVLGFCFFDGAAHSIWRQEAFQVFIQDLGDDTAVGWMSAASGVTQMISAVVAGFVGDRVKRESVLRVSSVAGFAAVLLTMVGVKDRSLTLLYLSQAVCGVYSGISATATEAIFADSVATGRRAFVYNLKWIDQTLCSCVGIAVSICVLVYLGNHWEQTALVKTIFVGLCLHPIAMSLLWILRDRFTLSEEQEGGLWASEGGLDNSKADAACIGGNLHKSAPDMEPMTPSLEFGLATDDVEDERVSGIAETVRSRMKTEDTPWHSYGGAGPPLPSPTSRQRKRDTSAASPAEGIKDGMEGSPGDADDSSGAQNDSNPNQRRHPNRAKRAHWSTAPPTRIPPPDSLASPISRATGTASATCVDRDRQQLVQRQLEHACKVDREEFQAKLAVSASLMERTTCVLRYYTAVLVTWEAVPYLVCLVDFLVAFGSGMTMRYLSLFIIKDYSATPLTLLTATLMMSPLQAILSHLVQRCGDLYTGRLPATIVARLIGTTLLLIMGTTHLPLNALLPIYIFRNALMNSTRGVTRSVIMDCVRKENRAKWSAFESFSSFTWAGSAVFGGYIAEARGYQSTFSITAVFHYVALAVLLPGAVGALPVERELMRANRSTPHLSCGKLMLMLSGFLLIAGVAFWWFRVEMGKRNW